MNYRIHQKTSVVEGSYDRDSMSNNKKHNSYYPSNFYQDEASYICQYIQQEVPIYYSKPYKMNYQLTISCYDPMPISPDVSSEVIPSSGSNNIGNNDSNAINSGGNNNGGNNSLDDSYLDKIAIATRIASAYELHALRTEVG